MTRRWSLKLLTGGCLIAAAWVLNVQAPAVPAAALPAEGSAVKAAAARSPVFPAFEKETIDDAPGKIVYAVTIADVDGDGRDDVVAVTENRVIAYVNRAQPGGEGGGVPRVAWQTQRLLENQTELDNVCIAPHDIDGDGRIDFALGAGWTKVGTLQWITRTQTPGAPWEVHPIAQEPWLHRIRWGDLLGTGRPQLVVSPLNKTQGGGVRLLVFEIPDNPRTDPWPATVIDQQLNTMHNHWLTDFDGDKRTDCLTASMEGVTLFPGRTPGQPPPPPIRIGRGMPGDESKPQATGAGELRVGRWQGRPFVCTVEPMHGTSVVVYLESPRADGRRAYERIVVDASLRRGHAVAVADMDRDGRDDLVIGHSDPGGLPPGVAIYTADDDSGKKWTRHVLDAGEMATEDLAVADLDGDGWLDVVAGGRATHNVRVYWNRGGVR